MSSNNQNKGVQIFGTPIYRQGHITIMAEREKAISFEIYNTNGGSLRRLEPTFFNADLHGITVNSKTQHTMFGKETFSRFKASTESALRDFCSFLKDTFKKNVHVFLDGFPSRSLSSILLEDHLYESIATLEGWLMEKIKNGESLQFQDHPDNGTNYQLTKVGETPYFVNNLGGILPLSALPEHWTLQLIEMTKS